MPGILALGLLAGVATAEDAELRVLRAWFALEDSKERAACERVFRDAVADADLPEDLRIRAEIGLARIERLDGRTVDARKRLEALVPRTKARPQLRRILLEQLGPPRWFTAVRVVPPAGLFLDLDSGGFTMGQARGPRGGPEMEGGRFLVPTVEDDRIADALPPMSNKPWHRLRTDEGNLSLVQVLSTSPQTVIRFVTRLGGFGDMLPAPRRPFCIGYNSKIELWWRKDERYVRYRVQRRIGPLAAWQRVQEFEGPPFIDRNVTAGRRYGYRIVGVTKEGYEGLPVTLQGTVRSRGVTRGSIEAEQNRRVQYDLLLGESVARGWDMSVVNVWQQGAMIQNHVNANVFALVRAPDGKEPLSPWDAQVTNQWQLKSGDRFLIPLFGGGVARCQIHIKQRKNGRWGATIDYEVYGDADVFPDPPTIRATETENGIELEAEAEEPFRVSEVVVRELISRSGPWSIELDDDGKAIDKNAKSDEVREYSVVGVDPHGRRTLAGRTTVVRLPDKPVHGEFKLRFQQGFSFERRGVVPMGEADIYFQQANSGIDRIYFQTPYGVRNVKSAFNWQSHQIDDVQIFDRIAGVENANVALRQTAIWTNKRNRAENVLILRTRHGGWVKLVIADRGTSGNWTQRLATFRYVYNPRSPRFDEGAEDIAVHGGIQFSGLKSIEARSKVISDWNTSWNALWRDGGFRRHMRSIAPAGGGVADADECQEVILEQGAHNNHLATARYSFSLARRDPVEGNLLASVWDLRWQNEHFHARLAGGTDKSTITDLGRFYWTRLRKQAQLTPWTDPSARVRMGHVYLHRKVMGNVIGAPTLFRVIGLEPWRRLQIEWVSLRDGALKTSPGLEIDEATRGRLTKLLKGLPADDKATRAMLGDKAMRTYAKLHAERVASVGRKEVKLTEFVEDLRTVTGLKFVLEGDVGSRKISILRNGTNAHSLLMDIVDSGNLEWRIDSDGRIHLRPRVLTAAEEKEEAEAEKRRAAARERERKAQEEAERKKKLEALDDVRDALKAAIEELEEREPKEKEKDDG